MLEDTVATRNCYQGTCDTYMKKTTKFYWAIQKQIWINGSAVAFLDGNTVK